MNSAASSAAEGGAPGRRLTSTCTILIPAFDESATIGQVVDVARRAGLGEVLVVDDGSRDTTAEVARRAGAQVLELGRNRGKGGAVAAGLAQLSSDVVVLLDADLVGLTPKHLRLLALPVLTGEADMTRGVFSGGRWRTTAAQKITPQLNGQRAVRLEMLLAVPKLDRTRYGLEVAITEAARRQGWRCADVPLTGVSQVMKEEKRGLVPGLFTRLRMYLDILVTLLRNR